MKCPNCGTDNPSTARFCSRCANPLAQVRNDVCKCCGSPIGNTDYQMKVLGSKGVSLCVGCAEDINIINNTTDHNVYVKKTNEAMDLLNSESTDEEVKAILLEKIDWERKFPNTKNTIHNMDINDINDAAKQAISNVRNQIKDSLPDDFSDSAKQAMYNFKDGVSGALNSVNGKSGWYRVVKFVGYLLLLASTIAGGALGYMSQAATSIWDSGGDEVGGMIVGALIGFVIGIILLCITMMFAEMAANVSTAVDLLSSINEKLDKNDE